MILISNQQPNTIYIFTDGAFRLKYNIGAWSFILQNNTNYFEIGEAIVNNPILKNVSSIKMETKAAINSLKKIKDKKIPVVLTTDSKYVCDGINVWSKYWVTHDWRNKQGDTIKNLELWKELLCLANSFHNIKILHVRGHIGNPGNERCDQICNEKMDEYLLNA